MQGVNAAGVLEEAHFFGIESLVPQLEALAGFDEERRGTSTQLH